MRALERSHARGFTLLEVMVAVAILGLGMTAILSAQAGAFAAAGHARNISVAVGLARCKMMELEEDSLRNGFQQTDAEDDGPCCDGDEQSTRLKCHWLVEVPVMPTAQVGAQDLMSSFDPDSLGPLAQLMQPGGAKSMFGGSSDITDVANQLFGQAGMQMPGSNVDPSQVPISQLGSISVSVGASGSVGSGPGLMQGMLDPNAPLDPNAAGSGNPMDVISGLVMGMIYPQLQSYFEGSSRRATVEVYWTEGSKKYSLKVEQWIVQPQQGIPDDTEDDDTLADDSSSDSKKSKKGKESGHNEHKPSQAVHLSGRGHR